MNYYKGYMSSLGLSLGSLDSIDNLNNQFALGLESEEVSDILTSATLLRGLIRMKIADKNDIGTARFALEEMLHFFTTLRARAEAQKVEDWDVFCQLQH